MKRLLILTYFWMVIFMSYAHLDDATIIPLNGNYQLPSNEITCIFQDTDGFVWYGTTDGLCRYDGYGIHEFRKDVFHPERVDVHRVTNIVQDRSHHLWVGTSRGLLRIDLNTFDIVRMDHDELKDSQIDYLISAADGTIWAMGSTNLYHISSDMSILNAYHMPEYITCLYEDTHRRIFVSRYAHGFMVLEPGAKDFKVVSPHYNISTMIEDVERGCYWLCDRDRGIIKYVNSPSGEPQIIPQKPVLDWKGSNVTFFTHMVQDDRFHYIWAISYYRGLHVLDVNSEGRLDDIQFMPGMLQNNHIFHSIMKDNDGNLWVTGFDTHSFIVNIEHKRVNHNSLSRLASITNFSPSVLSLYRDQGGIFWIMQMRNNLWLYDADHDTWVDYARGTSAASYPLYLTRQIAPAHQHNHVWAITDHSAYLLRRSGMDIQVFRTVTPNVGGNQNVEVTTAYEDSRHTLWVATSEGLYIWYNHIDTGSEPLPTAISPERLPGFKGEVSDIIEDSYGNMWCSVRDQGLLKITPSHTTTLYPLSIDMLTLSATPGYIWIGTREGRIFRFDESQAEGHRFTDFTEECGLGGQQIVQLETDCYNHLWVLSNQRVKEYDPLNGASHIMSTTESDSPFSRIMPRSIFIDDADSMVYIGGTPGYISVKPRPQFERNRVEHQPVITDVMDSGSSLWFSSEAHTSGHLTLQPSAHNITITFSTLQITERQNIRYKYKLDGVDDDWTVLDAGLNSAIYNRIPRGRHTFRLMATGTDGLWNDHETTLVIYRMPDWYESTLAYVVYALVVLLIIVSLAYAYQRRLKAENQKQLNDKITQAKMAYFTGISHELLTPLTIINLLASRLETNDESTSAPRLIQANVARLRRLLQQVLDFRKMESHNMKLYVEQVNVSEFLTTLSTESFSPLAADRHIQFTTMLPTQQITGYVDSDKLEKILFNLVSNAFKYTNADGTVTLSATQADGWLTLKVADSGVGIDLREQKFIFNPFYSSKKNDNTISNGIGLSITRQLVTLHHGTIDVESQTGRGSTFTVVLPLDVSHYSEAEIKTPPLDADTSAPAADLPATHQATTTAGSDATGLLMVEDNLELLSVMQDMLSEQYTVYVARDGIEALDILRSEDIGIVVSDVSMPRMDGIELCRQVKTDIALSHTIFVLLTAMTSSQTQVDGYSAGADAYLPKPFDTPVLLSLLGSLLAGRAKMQQHFQHTAMQTAATEVDSTMTDIDRQFVQRAIHFVEHHISDSSYDVEALCADTIMSRSTLTRKLKALTGQTPVQFIRSIRLKYAYHLLQNQTVSVADAMYRVGYNDQRSFTLAFKDMFGITPGMVKGG